MYMKILYRFHENAARLKSSAYTPRKAMSFSHRRGALRALIAATFLALASVPSLAQDSYPNKPVRIVVGFEPGGLTDTYARLFATHLQTKFGQPFLVENKPGAATIIGTQFVAKAPADGYTLCFCVSNVYTNKFFRAQLPYKMEDLTAIGLAFRSSSVLIVPETSPFQNAEQLVDFAKKNPGKLNYSTTGAGGATHITGELFSSLAGIRATSVHYKGAAPASMAVGTQEVDFAFSAIATAQPLLKQKKVRALGVSNDVRTPALPDVPTLGEAGFKGIVTGVWYGLMAPTGTPASVINLMNKELNAFFTSPPIKERLQVGGETPMGTMTPQQMTEYVAKDTEMLRKVIEPLNIKLD
ncbi:tripartite-type tricarboxylate transporter receptor subunit TctC [Ottowia thiooxydans]|uniref:Tripartite-type tricarboxylate transporter receptor subunit TctC n=2 Tax=Ottowia thiooxydans TaxID=219182 RepID=A0ABV2Q2C4_9BURK